MITKNLTPPEECETLAEIREQMDTIDREMIAMLAQRVGYVRAAAKFKTSAALVSAPDRVQAVLNTRREWAEQAGLDGATIEAIYRDIVAYCISEEKKHWDATQNVS